MCILCPLPERFTVLCNNVSCEQPFCPCRLLVCDIDQSTVRFPRSHEGLFDRHACPCSTPEHVLVSVNCECTLL